MNEVIKYSVGNFVVSQMVPEDRVISEYSGPTDKCFVFRRNTQDLKYIANALQHHCSSLLEGTMDWLEAYEKSDGYSEPVIVKRKC